MGNNHLNKQFKNDLVVESIQIEHEDFTDSFDLKGIPNNEVFMQPGSAEDSSSEAASNRNSSEQALRICMENPNFMSDLSKNIDKQVLTLRYEYREAILSNITNANNEISEIHLDSDYLYL